MQLGEFFIALGFDVDDKKLKEFNENIKDGLKDLLKLSAVAAGAVYAVNAFVDGSVRAATALRNFQTETGNSIEGLQKWQVASVLTNSAISADQVTASYKAMAQAISDVTMGKGPAGVFAQLGVGDVRGRDVADVMEDMRRNFDKNVAEWGLPQTVNMMKEVGFDPGMLNALKITREEFDKLAANKMMTPEQQQRLVVLGNAISKFKMELVLLKNQISAQWSPKLIEVLQEAIPVFLDFAYSVETVRKALTALWKSFDPAWQKAMVGVAVALVAYFNPVAAVFTAIAAAIWDIGRALRGLESYTGKSLLWLLNLMESDEGSKIGGLKKMLEAAGNGKASLRTGTGQNTNDDDFLTPVPADFLKRSDLMRFYDGNLNPAVKSDQMAERMMQNNQTTMSNIWNIDSTADAMVLAGIVMERQKQMLNSSLAEQNNGPRY